MIKPIKDFPGYFISDDGKVFCNLGRGNRNREKIKDLYEISPRLTKGGYSRICARQKSTNKRKDLYIHRLVAENFILNPESKPCVNHINCNRQDNRIENLEWCTHKENNEYAMKLNRNSRDSRTGRFKRPQK